jgi:phenylpyruvate tautomerase PptA (4-oxalocrotonate tautomerase family)
MPLIHISAPSGTFSNTARDDLAEELTVTALECEKLPMTPFDKSTTWIYFHESPPELIYHGGKPGGTKVIAIEVNAFEGGLDEPAKLDLYKRFTDVIRKHASIPKQARAPVYIVLREVKPINWGVFGGTTRIEELRIPHPDEAPI